MGVALLYPVQAAVAGCDPCRGAIHVDRTERARGKAMAGETCEDPVPETLDSAVRSDPETAFTVLEDRVDRFMSSVDLARHGHVSAAQSNDSSGSRVDPKIRVAVLQH